MIITLFQGYGEASFYAVYDGHNGLDSAVYSSMYLHQYLVQSIHYPTNPEQAFYEAIYSTDKGFTQKTENYVSFLILDSMPTKDFLSFFFGLKKFSTSLITLYFLFQYLRK